MKRHLLPKWALCIAVAAAAIGVLFLAAGLISRGMWERAWEARNAGWTSREPLPAQEAAEPGYSQGILYVRSAGDTWTVCSIGTCTDRDVRIPPVSQELPVTAVGKDAFRSYPVLRSILLPEGLQTVEAGAFSGCVLLEWVALPQSIRSIGQGAFLDCSALKTVIYAGTAEQWYSLQIAESSGLEGVAVQCSDGSIPME